MAAKRLQNEIRDMIDSPTEGIELINASPDKLTNATPDNAFKWDVKIHGPKDSPYDGGVFDINVTFPPRYPFQEPRLHFKTPIYHFNVGEGHGYVRGLHTIENWSAALTVNKVLMDVQEMMRMPQEYKWACSGGINWTAFLQIRRNPVEFHKTAMEHAQKYAGAPKVEFNGERAGPMGGKRRQRDVQVKIEDADDGLIRCPECNFGILMSERGCNMIVCRRDHNGKGWFYFCAHCRCNLQTGLPCMRATCPERNDRASRASAKRRRNEDAALNPIVLSDEDE